MVTLPGRGLSLARLCCAFLAQEAAVLQPFSRGNASIDLWELVQPKSIPFGGAQPQAYACPWNSNS